MRAHGQPGVFSVDYRGVPRFPKRQLSVRRSMLHLFTDCTC